MSRKLKRVLGCWQLYVFLLPCVLYFIIFRYIPMYGVQIAFKEFNPMLGITASPILPNGAFSNFIRFFKSNDCLLTIGNTIIISVYNLIIGFPLPILLAILLSQTKCMWFKKTVQTTLYAPHFISIVVIVGMINLFLAPNSGFVNFIIQAFGGEPVYFMAEPTMFKTIYVLSDIWQTAGYSSIVYIAALAAVSPELHEAGVVDGATKLQRIWYIDLPSIMPTAVTLLIMNSGRVLSVGFEKIFLMQNSVNRSASEVLSTFVYKTGFGASTGIADVSYASAIGLFEAIVSLVIILSVNKIAKKMTDTGIL